MSRRLERLAVLGLGLLGGSVAWAARKRGLAREVVGGARSADVRAWAVQHGLVDRAEADPAAAVRDAELVVLATPVAAMPALLRQAGAGLAAGALVTDVGSVKGVLAETLPGLLPAGACYVGSHPMAGSHRRGARAARADLLEGAVCVVTPGPGADPAAVARLEGFWRDLGARVTRREPAAHDAEVAWISHVPHALAFAFARALEAAPPGCQEVAGPGFRDFTRIARSDPALWAGILEANRKALGEPLARVAERLGELARILESGDAAEIERFLTAARRALAAQDAGQAEAGRTGEADRSSKHGARRS